MTRIELINQMIAGDLKAAYHVIYEDFKVFNKAIKCSKCTNLFLELGVKIFHRNDIEVLDTIRSFVFEYVTEKDDYGFFKRLIQIRDPQAFDTWLRRTATRLIINKQKEIRTLIGEPNDPPVDDNNPPKDNAIDTDMPCEPFDETESDLTSEKDNRTILAEIYNARNDIELVQKLISNYKSVSTFGSKGQPIYAKILELKIIQKMSDKDIAKEIGISHKNMSNLTTRAMTSLTAFVIKKIKGYEQKNQ